MDKIDDYLARSYLVSSIEIRVCLLDRANALTGAETQGQTFLS
jgi:hypothetical protein